MLQKLNKKLVLVSALNALLIAFYVFFAYTSVGQSLAGSWFSSSSGEIPDSDLVIAQAGRFSTLDPHVLAPDDRVALGLIYEPLVRFDEFFNLAPALAYTWYYRETNELVLELRSNALFHNGESVSCDDVVASVARAQTLPASSLKAVLNGVDVVAESERVCLFTLPAANHNFLRQLTEFYILPADVANEATRGAPLQAIGAGRYRLIDRDQTTLLLEAFTDYYFFNSELPESLALLSEGKKYNRLSLLKEGLVDVLLDVPTSFVPQIEARYGYDVGQVPNYESLFLLFNTHNPELAKQPVREHLASLISTIPFTKILNDPSLYDLEQFAPSGIFGFTPKLIDHTWPIAGPFEEQTFFSLGVTEDYKKVGEILQAKLADQNIDLSLNVLSPEDFTQMLAAGKLDLYLTGWRFELGTVDGFFRTLIQSDGALAGFGYDNPGTDTQIATNLTEQVTKQRLRGWQDLMQQIILNDVIGAPLLGARRLYAVREGVTVFTPRMDGLVIFNSHYAQ